MLVRPQFIQIRCDVFPVTEHDAYTDVPNTATVHISWQGKCEGVEGILIQKPR